MKTRWRAWYAALACALVVSGCSSGEGTAAETASTTVSTTPAEAPSSTAPSSTAPNSTAPSSTAPPTTPPAPEPSRPAGPTPSDGTPRRATLTIDKLGISEQPVVPYRGWTDDAPGTDIQNGGRLATPFGPRGGVGPGGLGNYQVTGHRLSSTRLFEFLPDLRRGDLVVVRAAGTAYTYRISETRETSFRSPESLRAQRAAVPGKPGAAPTQAMITLSTCATPEDHAEGNYWSDEFDNPEHRIDKIGVLVKTAPAG